MLANRDSGQGEAEAVERMLSKRGDEPKRFALDESDDVVAFGPSRIIVAGGDGSVGCGAAAASRAAVPLGVVPVGTANDFARALEIPDELEAAVELAAAGTRTRAVDLGRVGERPFVNAASAGLAPVAAREAHGLKQRLGPLAYLVGAVRAGLSTDPIRCRVVCDETELFAGEAWQVIVACTGAFGGGSEVDADPHDGVLDVVIIEGGSRTRLVHRAYGIRTGGIEEQTGVITGEGREVNVDTDGVTGFNVDGEVLEDEQLHFTIEARAFEVVVG